MLGGQNAKMKAKHVFIIFEEQYKTPYDNPVFAAQDQRFALLINFLVHLPAK